MSEENESDEDLLDNDEEFDINEEAEDADEAPTQDDIFDGICVDDQRRMAHHRHNLYFDLGKEEADEDDAYATAFWEGLAAVIDENGDEDLRIFHVNDHGNVTEYDTEGRVIGEWV